MNSEISGMDFYNVLVELGEKVTFLTTPEILQYASIKPHKKTNSTEGAYWYFGNMTFDSVDQQNTILGEYFKRQTNPQPVYILTAVMPENTTERMGTVYAVECNDKVNIISHYERIKDEYGDYKDTPVYAFKNIDVYTYTTLKETKQASVGAFIETITNLLIPAKYTLSPNNIIEKQAFVFNNANKKNDLTFIPYRIESIDMSMFDDIQVHDYEGSVETKYVGILRCMLSESKGVS